MALGDTRVPVTVLTGYLGAGKSTVLNHVLKSRTGARYAVIVNEFGEVGIDGELIETGDEDLIELSSGCLCCVVRGDLIRTLKRLLKRDHGLDGILIETTGVANPSPVIQTFTADQVLAKLARLDAVVTVVDAIHGPLRLEDSPDAVDQVALASIILLNKAGDVEHPEAVEALLRGINPHAPIHHVDRGRIAPGLILGTESFSLERVAADLAAEDDNDDHHTHHTHHHHDHVAANGIASVSVTLPEALDPEALDAWIERFLMLRGESVLRLKGILNVDGEDNRIVVQAVHMMYEVDRGAAWDDRPRGSRLVVIGRDLDQKEIRDGLFACRAAVTA